MMTENLTAREKTVAAWVCELVVAWAAILLGLFQFADDGGSLLFQVSRKVLGGDMHVGFMFISMGAVGLVMAGALINCREMRIFIMLCQTALWVLVLYLYVEALSIRPIVAMALLMAMLSLIAFSRLVIDYARRQ